MQTIRVRIDDETAELIAARIDDAHPNLNAVARRILFDHAHTALDQPGFRVCTCETLQRLAEEPASPVIFDAVTKEYSLVQQLPHGQDVHTIGYCIACGGRAPVSKRANMFAKLDHAEVARLAEMCVSIQTFKDAFEAFGPPECDWAIGQGSIERGQDGAEEWSTKRVIRYEHLSDTACVHFTQATGDLVSVSFVSKKFWEAEA